MLPKETRGAGVFVVVLEAASMGVALRAAPPVRPQLLLRPTSRYARLYHVYQLLVCALPVPSVVPPSIQGRFRARSLRAAAIGGTRKA